LADRRSAVSGSETDPWPYDLKAEGWHE